MTLQTYSSIRQPDGLESLQFGNTRHRFSACLRLWGEATRLRRMTPQVTGQNGIHCLPAESSTGLLKKGAHWADSKGWEKNHWEIIFCSSRHPSLRKERRVAFHTAHRWHLGPSEVTFCHVSGAGWPRELTIMGLCSKAHRNTPADYRQLTIKPCRNKILPINNVSHMLYLRSAFAACFCKMHEITHTIRCWST